MLKYVIGVDESGCGAIAGSLVVAAVAFRHDDERVAISWKTKRGAIRIEAGDSKTIRHADRRAALAEAVETACLTSCVEERTAAEIDARLFGNVFPEAVQHATSRCLDALKALDPGMRPHECLVLVDGDIERPEAPCPVQCIPGGDALHWQIGAASILAKARHDVRVAELEAAFPDWGFVHHRGYPTKAHKAILAEKGPIAPHRRTYNSVSSVVGLPIGIEE